MIPLKQNSATAAGQTGPGIARPAPVKRLLGRVLVDAGFITEEKLQAALHEQNRTNELLGEILVRLGEISAADLNIVLALQNDLADPVCAAQMASGVRKMLGEILLQARRITHAQLDEALLEQKRTGAKLGTTLIRRGLLSQHELHAALTVQHHQEQGGPASERLRLGELLVSSGYLTRQQLREALDRQRSTKKRLGEVLVDAGLVTPETVERVLRLQSMLLAAALAAAISLAPAAAESAQRQTATAGAKVLVSAMVPARASVTVLRQPNTIVVTDADVRRGFVEVPAAALIELKNNSSAGCLLVFETTGLPFREALVNGLGNEVSIGPDGGMVNRAVQGSLTASLSFRFVLSGDAQPGTYGWPFSLSAQPL